MTDGKLKFTKARRDMLVQIDKEPGYYPTYYPPMKWAINNGLVEQTREHSGNFRLTAAGRSALSESQP